MKKHFLILWAVTCLFVGCENENTLADKVVTGAATDITAKSVVLHGVVNVDDMQEFGMMIETSETALKNDGAKYPTEVLWRNDFEVLISGLKPNTKRQNHKNQMIDLNKEVLKTSQKFFFYSKSLIASTIN